MRRAGVYCRISEDRGGAGLGVERQRADCVALAERNGWQVVEVFVDNDLGAWAGRTRPAYRAMLDAIKAGSIDAVVVWHLDRLTRRPAELEQFFDVCDGAGLKHLATVSGDINLATDDGRFHARILGAVARKESDDKSRRLRRKFEEVAARGGVSGGGSRPFGFDDDRVTVRKDEATLIREAAKRVLAGEAVRGVCADFNRRGVKTPTGRQWKPHSFKRMLVSARICGQRSHRGKVVADAVWPAIISRDDGERLRAILNDPARRVNDGARRYLLTGFARCGLCGARLVARPREDKRRAMVCSTGPGFEGCGKIASLAEPLEDYVVEEIIEALGRSDLIGAIKAQDDDEPEPADDVAGIEEKLEDLARQWANDELDRVEWVAARQTLQARLEAAQKRRLARNGTTALEGLLGGPEAVRAAWGKLPLERRRAVVAALVDQVIVNPAVRGRTRFDPDRVQVVWRVT